MVHEVVVPVNLVNVIKRHTGLHSNQVHASRGDSGLEFSEFGPAIRQTAQRSISTSGATV